MVFDDWVRHDHAESRYSDRDLVRVFADENVPTYEFLIENGVEFIEKPIRSPDASTVRPHLRHQGMAHPEPGGRAAAQPQRLGPGAAARGERAQEGRADPAQAQDDVDRAREAQCAAACSASSRSPAATPVNIQARKGVIIATGGHTGNVNFRRMFDPRLTEEYQQACEPYVAPGRRRRTRRDGHRRLAVGDRATRPARRRRADHQDAPHRLPLGLLVAGLRARQPDVPAGAAPPASP